MAVSPAGMRSPVMVATVSAPTPNRPRVTFAPSPMHMSAEVTPYARVYGVHPAFFDFDRRGCMQPTSAGYMEMQRGSLHAITPTVKGRLAMIVQGSPSPSNSSVGSPLSMAGSPLSGWSPFAQPTTAVDTQFHAGEQVMVATDDGLAWMDAQVVAVFPTDTEAEGYSIPAGTVKVSYELGIKWVMPQNMATTLRKKGPSFMPPQRPNLVGLMPQTPSAAVPRAATWQTYATQMPYISRST